MNNEFKKSKSNNETRYTLESMTAGATGSGSIATSAGSLGKVQKRGNILAQEAGKDKVDASKPRNFVAKNAKMGGAGAHKDKKKEQKQGSEKHKKPYMEALKQKIEDLKSKLNEAQAEKKTGMVQDRKTGKWYDPKKEFEKKMNSPEVMAQMKRMATKEGKEDKIAQLKKDHETAVHWSKNETSPQKREAARQKAEKIKRHLDTQYKQGVAEGPELKKAKREYNQAAKDAGGDWAGAGKKINNMKKSLRQKDVGKDKSVAESDTYMESLAESLQEVLSEKAVSKKQQKFMGMVHAAQKGEKPASKEVAKVAKDMGKKDAKDFASTKHKGLPEKKKSKK